MSFVGVGEILRDQAKVSTLTLAHHAKLPDVKETHFTVFKVQQKPAAGQYLRLVRSAAR